MSEKALLQQTHANRPENVLEVVSTPFPSLFSTSNAAAIVSTHSIRATGNIPNFEASLDLPPLGDSLPASSPPAALQRPLAPNRAGGNNDAAAYAQHYLSENTSMAGPSTSPNEVMSTAEMPPAYQPH